MKQIDVLYFDSCPGWREALARVEQVVAEGGLGDEVVVRAVAIETDEEAQAQGFLGSPSVRIDGQDLEPSQEGRTSFALQCRLYDNAGRLEGLPPTSWIRKALGVQETAATSAAPVSPSCAGGRCR